MISRTFFLSALALLATTCSAAEERELQQKGVNLCAAHDIVVPRIADGSDNCGCEGRTLQCKFEQICNLDDTCADLKMDIDFSTPDEETIVYSASYSDTFEDVVLTLEVSPESLEDDGIQSCTCTLGEEECTCSACAEGRGVEISCSAGSTDGCQQIDAKNFERYVPFLGGVSPDNTIAKAEAASAAVTITTASAAAMAALFAVAVAI